MKFPEGEWLLDTFSKLPVKIQQIFMGIVYHASYNTVFHDDSKIADAFMDMIAIDGMCYESCESPIEVIFAFCYSFYLFYSTDGTSYFELFTLYNQKKIKANGKTYRVDFVIDTDNDFYRSRTEHPVKVVFECDGHEFHEKTKEQVEYGNKRDYDLKMAGYDVIHFSGSQIYNDPFECAKKALKFVLKKAGKIYE